MKLLTFNFFGIRSFGAFFVRYRPQGLPERENLEAANLGLA